MIGCLLVGWPGARAMAADWVVGANVGNVPLEFQDARGNVVGFEMLAEYQSQGRPVPVNHSPYFAPMPEPTIRSGVIVLTLAVMMVAGGGG
jgi:hypothetical protein